MNKWIKLGLIVISVTMLGACGTTGTKKSGEGAPVVNGQGQGAESATTTPVAPGGGAEATPLPGGAMSGAASGEAADLLSTKVVYFDYDSSTISDEDRAIIKAHAGYLSQHPDIKVTLEGNTDERGTREYNIGLGERRANAVKQMMLLMGVSDQQITTVSYGEERPAALGHDESAWHLNRRVEIVYAQ
jgi:peptidoglycan-associated lipoprotein